MISVLLSLALAAAAADRPEPGTLVGCAFLADGATEARPSFLGLGIYVPERRQKGPIPASLIVDRDGLLGGSGFEKVKLGPGLIRFRGPTSLELLHSGGGIFHARLDGVDRSGSCQLGQFPDRDSAFDFFDAFIQGLNIPE